MKKNNIRETIKELNKFSRMLSEAYVFDGGNEEMPQEGGEEQMSPEEGMGEMMMDNETDEIIDQIRQLALNGIQKYAEDVDNEMYVTYKKIWMMCDKCLSEKDKVEN